MAEKQSLRPHTAPRYIPRSFLANPKDFGALLTPKLVPETAENRSRLAGAQTQNALAWRVRLSLFMHGMTITQLARATGLNYQRLTRVIRGTILMRMEDIGAIAQVLPDAFGFLEVDDDGRLVGSSPGSRAVSSAHMVAMDPQTITRKPMFPHDVPVTEPPVGTVAVFRSSFAEGGGSSTHMMLHTENGWSTDVYGRRDLLSWAELTDLDTMNAAIVARDPRSTARYVAVQVVIVAAPLPQGAGA
jgi:hypothetical protein